MKQNRERYQFFSRYVHILYCLNTVCLGASRAPRKLRFLLLNVHYLTGYLPFFPFSSSKNSSSFIIIIIPLFLSSSMLRPFSFLFPFFFFYLPKRLILYYYSCILSSFIFGITFTRYILCKERNNVNSNNVLHPFLFYPSAFVLTFRIIHHDFLDYYFLLRNEIFKILSSELYIKNIRIDSLFIFCVQNYSRINRFSIFAISNRIPSNDTQSFTFN